jgi:hypothetical protein
VIDREVNSVELARKFEENDMGLLSPCVRIDVASLEK